METEKNNLPNFFIAYHPETVLAKKD